MTMQGRDFISMTAVDGAASVPHSDTAEAVPAPVKEKTAGVAINSEVELFSQDQITPQGKYYEATVPDTLDLAERGRLAVRGLINFLDPSQSYELYQMGHFEAQPAYMSHYGSVGCNWGKVTEGIVKTRHMCGSTENLEQEAEMFKGIFRLINDNGEFAVDSSHSWCWKTQSRESQIPANTSRVLIAFMAQSQLRPSARMTQLIVRMTDSICAAAEVEGDYAYLPGRTNPPWIVGNSGVLGDFEFIWNQGESLRGVARAYSLTGDQKYLEISRKLTNGLLKPEYWTPEAASAAVMAGEHGQFNGHMHSYVQALMGMLWYAGLANDTHVKEFVRESYEFLRTFGIARIGLFGEMCATGDMTKLAIKLSDLGVGDYWEDVDQYVRNQLVEQQATDAAKMHKANAMMPVSDDRPLKDYVMRGFTDDHVIDRFVGAWRSDANNPAMISPQNFIFVVCCSGNNPPALYAAWEGTVRYNSGVAQVNLLLNRASPWLDMDSYLPYEGKVLIRNKTARQIFVRIPRWVEQSKLGVEVNGKTRPPVWLGRQLFLDGMSAGDQVRIEFPLVESKETYTLKWKPEDRWFEGIQPGPKWAPQPQPNLYTLELKGNTVVDVSPRSEGPGYPLYERTYYRQTTAPMRQVTRYVSSAVVKV